MLKRETGTVVDLEGGQAAVRIRSERSDACGGCKACQAHGGGDFVLWLDAEDLKEGDRVTVEVAVPGPWRAMLLVFVLPLTSFVAGVLMGSEWQGFQQMTGLGREASGIVSGMGLLLASLLIALVSDWRFRRRHPPRVAKAHDAG